MLPFLFFNFELKKSLCRAHTATGYLLCYRVDEREPKLQPGELLTSYTGLKK